MSQSLTQVASKHADWPFQVKPLHPTFGCEITGITLEQAVEEKAFA